MTFWLMVSIISSVEMIFYQITFTCFSGERLQQPVVGYNSMIFPSPIGSMYGIYANIWGILMVNVSIYTIHGTYGSLSSHHIPVINSHVFSATLW